MAFNLIDTRAYRWLENFNGDGSDWVLWRFVARSYFAMLAESAELYLYEAEAAGTDLELSQKQFNDEMHLFSRTICHILVHCAQGKALTILQRGERDNGVAGWKALCEEYEPNIGSLFTAVLAGLLQPKEWRSASVKDFLTMLRRWEIDLVGI